MKHKYGCLPQKKDARDFKVSKVAKKIEYPKEFSLGSTVIKDQGQVGSCVAHALSSMLEKLNSKNMSTGFIYGYRPDDYWQGEGMYPKEAMNTLLKVGDVLNSDFNVNVEMIEAKALVNKHINNLMKKGKWTKIKSYARLYTEDEIKYFISSGVPVPISISVYSNINFDKDYIIQYEPDKKLVGGHMMLIYGWNENGWLVQNSWGSSWADKGCAILPYCYDLDSAWGVQLEDSTIVVKQPLLYQLWRLLKAIIKLFIRG